MPKLSIITINYNNCTCLEKTIESVLSQTSQNFEYIVVDGNSTDRSKEIISHYANLKLFDIIWISEPDTGIYNAMNKGIRLSSGDYIQFLNSGDILAAPNVTEMMLKDMPECGVYQAICN